MTSPGAVAEQVVSLALDRPPTLGLGRLVCVDGPAGSGKSTLANALRHSAGAHGSVKVLHMDAMYEGWRGLGDVSARVEHDLVYPLGQDRTGRFQRYDWDRDRFAEWHDVSPVDLLVLEGVGSGASSYASSVTVLVWVEAPRDLRIARGIARDGEAVLPNWLAWMASEEELFAREDTRARADVLVDGTGETEPQVRAGRSST